MSSGHGIDDDPLLAQHPEHAEVGQRLRPAAGQGQPEGLAGDPAGHPVERRRAAVARHDGPRRPRPADPPRHRAEGGDVLGEVDGDPAQGGLGRRHHEQEIGDALDVAPGQAGGEGGGLDGEGGSDPSLGEGVGHARGHAEVKKRR